MVNEILHNKPLSLVLPFYAGLTKLSNSCVCSILTEVTKKPLDFVSFAERIARNIDSESPDSRRLLLALMNCIYESQNKGICRLANFSHLFSDPQLHYASFTGLDLDPMDCMSLGYFFANKQLDQPCAVGLNGCCVGDIGIEVLMKELSQGCILSEKAIGIELVLSGSECSPYGMKCIGEAISHAPVLWGLQFVGWNLYKIDAAICLKYLVEGLCRRSVEFQSISLQKCVSYKHTYHLNCIAYSVWQPSCS